MVLLRRSVGAVGVGSVPGGAAGGARLSVLRLCEGRVPSRDYVGRDKVPVARERGVGVGKRLVGRREGWVSEGWASGSWASEAGPPPWPVAGDGAPGYEVRGEVVVFQRFLERAAETHLWAPNRVGAPPNQ
jgi:hypothetical protein